MSSRVSLSILLLGIIIRLLLWLPQSATNPDPHIQVIQYLENQGTFPSSAELTHSFHPPLYYYLAWGWSKIGGVHDSLHEPRSLKIIQLLSVLISITHLILIRQLLQHFTPYSGKATTNLIFAIAALHPPFLIWSGFISNDGLSYLLGTCIVLTTLELLSKPSPKSLFLSALTLGLGLCTKMSLLCFLPPWILILYFSKSCQKFSHLLKATAIALPLLIASPKPIQNLSEGLHPFFHNMEQNPLLLMHQRESFTDPLKATSLQIIQMIKEPYFTENPPYSIPTLFFASFWHDYFPDQTNFQFLKNNPPWVFPRLQLFLGLVLSLIFFILIITNLRQWIVSWISKPISWNQDASLPFLLLQSSLALIGIIFILGIRYDAWSCIQGRLFYPCFTALLLMASLLETQIRRFPHLIKITTVALLLFLINSITILVIELYQGYLLLI